MFEILITSLLILSHVLSDFFVPIHPVDDNGKSDAFKYPLLFLLSALILTSGFMDLYLFFLITSISILFYGLNVMKVLLKTKRIHLIPLTLFISKHFLHLLIITTAYPLIKGITPNKLGIGLFDKLQALYPILQSLNHMNNLSYGVLVIAGLLFSIRGGTSLAQIIIRLPRENYKREFKAKAKREKESLSELEVAAALENESFQKINAEISGEERMKYGRVIGNIERLLIITAVLASQYEIIVIITAIKSIGRFKELSNKTSDYFIIGNFASYAIGFVIGFILLAAKRFLLA